jgi:hypothetical protein
MLRTRAAALPLLLLVCAACEGGAEKAKDLGKKIDDTVTKLDTSEADTHLKQAHEQLAAGKEPVEACSWASSSTANNAAAEARPSIDALRRLCSLEVPLTWAKRAVTAAETARAEQPQAPSLTECSSDDWPKAIARLDKDHPGEPRVTEIKARWTKVCPGP